ncbi:type 1 glutamine amidotransferase domain-containing protein [Gilvimarinus agarilyticus]|uniref:type 1 glutamine amidotransferase domain-containing protein n=1 Tax=Gilvimarinus agarilyticus TaxID=679259 RepID=UPI0005A28453|nr:type 1 glutamine amidotransferase domain-containing protein [Gilvimarinus agarilyticus]
MKVLMVLTSHDQLGDTGNKTGFWLEEFTAPYYTFLDAGAEITLASPKGGKPPLDPKSDDPDGQTESTKRYADDTHAQQALANTKALAEVSADEFDAVFYPGGHGPLWDLAQSATSVELIESFAKANKPHGFVCHAPAVLRDVKDACGAPLVQGKKVTGFSNSEEEGVGLTDVVPFLLEDMLKTKGATYQKGDDWQSYSLIDGKLVTGQNPASSEQAAKDLLSLLK